jgi:hypothetical protein
MAATNMVDFNGTPLALGQTVKLVGTITALNPFDNKFREVTITLSHPVPGVPDVIVAQGADPQEPGAVKTISVSPTMLVVGA